VHFPLLVLEAPCRNSVELHEAWSLHSKPSSVPWQLPVRYFPDGHWILLQSVQLPFAEEEEPLRNWAPAWQDGCEAHSKPFVVPLQVPVLYSPAPHCVLLQSLHDSPLVDPEHIPL